MPQTRLEDEVRHDVREPLGGDAGGVMVPGSVSCASRRRRAAAVVVVVGVGIGVGASTVVTMSSGSIV